MTKQAITLLGAEDQANYESVITDLIKLQQLNAGNTTHEIVQLMTPGVIAYVGAYIIVDGPIISRSSGPEPAWRKYIYVDTDWNERVFGNIGALYDYVATQFHDGVLRKHRYTRTKTDAFELIDVATFNVAGWANRHANE